MEKKNIDCLIFLLKELTRKVVEKEEGLHQHHEADHIEHDSEEEHTPSKLIKLFLNTYM